MENVAQPSALQLLFVILTLITGLSVVLATNPVVSAVMLMATLFLTGGLYFGMGFYFIGAAQILIYAGAISVLFIFIVMLLDLRPSRIRIPGRQWVYGLGALAVVLLAIGLMALVLPGTGTQSGVSADFQKQIEMAAGAKTISLNMLSKYMLPFQITGLLILGAVMGVVVLGRPTKKV